MSQRDTQQELAKVRDAIGTQRREVAELEQRLDEGAKGFNIDLDDPTTLNTPEFREAMEAQRNYGEAKDELVQLEQYENYLVGKLGSNGFKPVTGVNPQQAIARAARAYGWNGHAMLANSAEYQTARERGTFHSGGHFGTIDLGHVASREGAARMFGRSAGPADYPNPHGLPAADEGTVSSQFDDEEGQNLLRTDDRGLITPLFRPFRFLDLVPSGTTDSQVINYVRLVGVPGHAEIVEELEIKPEAGIAFADASAPVRTIAVWMKISRIALDDIPLLGTLINQLLPRDVRGALEHQMLAGDGSGNNLTGIFETDGVQEIAAEGGDTVADAVLRGLTMVTLTEQTANFVLLNPIAWQNLALSKASGSGTYMFDISAAMGGLPTPTLWGLRVVQDTAIDDEQALVGDTAACMLLFREGVVVRTSDSDQDDFIHNRVTVLCEARAAFVVWRPTAFCVVTDLPS
jgi:HK97 family phage major capsid protein